MTNVIQLAATGIMQGLIYALIGLGLYLGFAVLRIANLAHGFFVLIGMYIVLAFNPRSMGGFVVAIIIGALIAGVIGYLVQRFLLESGLSLGGHSQLIITIGLGIVFQYTFQVLYPVPFSKLPNPYPFSAITGNGITLSAPRLVAAALSILLVAAVSFLIYRTRAGTIIRSCSDSISGAVRVGINVPRVYRLTFALSCVLAAIAGGILIPIEPVSPALGLDLTIKAFIVVVIGGAGSLWGTVFAGILVGLAEALGSLYAPGTVSTALVYALFFLVILVRPQGLIVKSEPS